MSGKVYWLNAQLFVKTKEFMHMSNGRLSEYILENQRKAFREQTNTLREELYQKCKNTVLDGAPLEFVEKWCLLDKKVWTPDLIEGLDDINRFLKESPNILLPPSWINQFEVFMQNKYPADGNPKSRFAISSIKNMCDIRTEQTSFKETHAIIFIRYAMLPYFSKNKREFQEYLSWLRNPNNLLKVSIDSGENLQYFPHQRDSVIEPIETYIEVNGFDFKELDFFNMMQELFRQLYMISAPSEYHKKETDQRIRENVKKTYWSFVFPDFYPGTYLNTLGISEEEMNTLIDEAVEDTLTAYWSFWTKCKNSNKPSWDDCIRNNGFYMEMLYFLYNRLWHQESEYLKIIALNIRDEGFKQYKTYISEKANIAATVFIIDNCYIEEGTIMDNVFLKNCYISDGVIIREGCVLDAISIKIEQNVHISAQTKVIGPICVHIVNSLQ